MNTKFTDLRSRFPEFIYDGFSKEFSKEYLKVKYRFIQSDEIIFEPELTFFTGENKFNVNDLDSALFNLGMIELVSYYKACCSPVINIKAGSLSSKQIAFWKKIYFHGLGEFLYMNKIETTENELFKIICSSDKSFEAAAAVLNEGCLIPVGGGKDSVVSLELLKHLDCLPLILNPREASIQSVLKSGYKDFFRVERVIDPGLLKLNKAGYLNGHTPFSALLAFASAVCGLITGRKNIVLSNENSASVGNAFYSGIEVNHQYSKSFEAEKALHDYISAYIHKDLNYFSFLRPLNELKIAGLFSRFKAHYPSFRSCNAGSKANIWCCKCPKCLFTCIILSPFIDKNSLISIFGSDLLNDKELENTFNELTGDSGIKPFECVGTKEEVNAAIAYTISRYGSDALPYLLDLFRKNNTENMQNLLSDFDTILNEFNKQNLLNDNFRNILSGNL